MLLSDISPLKHMKLLMLKQVVGTVADRLFINFIFYRQPNRKEVLCGTVVPQNTKPDECSCSGRCNCNVVTELDVVGKLQLYT